MKHNSFSVVVVLLLVIHASIPGTASDLFDGSCLIPCEDITDPFVERDEIPAINQPKFVTADEVGNIYTDETPVVGIVVNGQPRAYSTYILDRHEIVNDFIDTRGITLSWCPLTGTGIYYDALKFSQSSQESSIHHQMGVSGLLYENNLIMYDRNTNNLWMQMTGLSIQGDRIGEFQDPLPVVQTTFGVWNSLYPNSEYLDAPIGRDFDYTTTGYVAYQDTPSIYYQTSYDPSNSTQSIYDIKETVLVIKGDDRHHLIPYPELDTDTPLQITIDNQDLVIFHSVDHDLTIPYILPADLEFVDTRDNQEFPFFIDNLGNQWNILGQQVDAENELVQKGAYSAYWFAAVAFFPTADIYVNGTTIRFTDQRPVYDQYIYSGVTITNTSFFENQSDDISEQLVVFGIIAIGILAVLIIIYQKFYK